MPKSRRDEWDPRAVKVVLATVKKIVEKKKREKAQPTKDAATRRSAEKRIDKVIGRENAAAAKPAKAAIVTGDETLRRQMDTQLSRVRHDAKRR